MKELIKKTETYRVDTEDEAIDMIQDFRNKASIDYEVTKATYVKKQKKQKGEIVDEWVIAEITFNYEV